MDDLPIRRLSRLGNEAHLAVTLDTIALGKGRYEWGVVALLLLSRCVDDWVSGNTICRPLKITNRISVRAVAQSLGAPYASIHRYVAGLKDANVVIAIDGGYAINNDPGVAPTIIAFLAAAHDRLIRLMEDLAPDLEAVMDL